MSGSDNEMRKLVADYEAQHRMIAGVSDGEQGEDEGMMAKIVCGVRIEFVYFCQSAYVSLALGDGCNQNDSRCY